MTKRCLFFASGKAISTISYLVDAGEQK